MLLASGCISEGGKWQYATVVSKSHEEGNIVAPSSNVVVFNDVAGNIYILHEEYQTPFQSLNFYKILEVNQTYLIHVNGNGYVDRVDLESE